MKIEIMDILSRYSTILSPLHAYNYVGIAIPQGSIFKSKNLPQFLANFFLRFCMTGFRWLNKTKITKLENSRN